MPLTERFLLPGSVCSTRLRYITLDAAELLKKEPFEVIDLGEFDWLNGSSIVIDCDLKAKMYIFRNIFEGSRLQWDHPPSHISSHVSISTATAT